MATASVSCFMSRISLIRLYANVFWFRWCAHISFNVLVLVNVLLFPLVFVSDKLLIFLFGGFLIWEFLMPLFYWDRLPNSGLSAFQISAYFLCAFLKNCGIVANGVKIK
jgi:hypothetical protein